MAKQTVTVTQFYNPKYDAGKPDDGESNAEYVYKVERTTNTLVVKIGQSLTPSRVQGLIDQDIGVTVVPVK